MSIHQNGFWEGLEADSQHYYDFSLGKSLVKFFTPFYISNAGLTIHFIIIV
jgi:hypothetical protein